MYHLYLGELHW